MNKCSYFNLAVASFLEGRQGDQCMHRYTQTLQMVRKGKWTEEEDEVIPAKREAHRCILVFKCLTELVPPHLSDYFIKNHTIHTYKTRQRNGIHLPYVKLTRLDVQVRFFFIIDLHHQKKLHRFSLKRTFLDFIVALNFSYKYTYVTCGSSLIRFNLKQIVIVMKICNFPFSHF